MKRSDAVKQLKYWLFGASDDPFHKEETERLLEKIENMGFLPPFSLTLAMATYPRDMDNGHKWESEDEKK